MLWAGAFAVNTPERGLSMKSRRAVWGVGAVFSLAAIVVMIPGTPVYLPNLFISRIRYEGHTIGHWIQTVENPDPDTRQHAIFALGAIGPDAGEAVPRLAKLMVDDPVRETRIEAALALSKMA